MSAPFSGCKIFFLGFYKSLVKIKSEIKENGGTVASLLSSSVTHLITTDCELMSTTVGKAQSYNAYVLSEDWVLDSITKQQRQPEANYFLGEEQPTSSDSTKKEKIVQHDADTKAASKSSSLTFDFTASPLKLGPSGLDTSPYSPIPRPDWNSSYLKEEEEEEEIIPQSTWTSFGEEQVTESISPVHHQPEEPTSIPTNVETLPDWIPFKITGKKAPKVATVRVKANKIKYAKDFAILGQVTLQLSNLGNNNNKYYALELHHDSSSRQSPFRIFCHYGRTCDLENNPEAGQQCYRYYSKLEQARISFQSLYDEKRKKGYNPLELRSSNVGSQRAKNIRLAALSSSLPVSQQDSSIPSSLHPTLQSLVLNFYEEASKTITASVNAKITPHGIETALGVVSERQIKEGEGVLMKIKNEIAKGNSSKLTDLSNQFYTLIPHKIGKSEEFRRKSVISSLPLLEQKVELLQLMRDMLSLISAGGVGNVVDMKYKALKTNMVPLERSSSFFQETEAFVLGSQTSQTNEIRIRNIFAVRRPQEKLYSAIGNIQLQFHGSRPCNFVGLLSRGLLMPKIVVTRGGGRTDAGLLGNGIYFTDSITTASQYAHPTENGSRFVLANRVALGRCRDFTETQIGLERPPFGYHSVHGVSKAKNPSSFFKDEEFVVFESNQQMQEYLIEFDLSSSSSRVCPAPTPRSLPDSIFRKSIPSQRAQPASQAPQPASLPSQASQLASLPSQAPQPASLPSTEMEGGNKQEIQSEEEYYRKLFASSPNHSSLKDPYVHLIDIMSNVSSFQHCGLNNEEASWESLLSKFVDRTRLTNSLSICPSLSAFEKNWNAFSENQFAGLNWNNVFIAGGAILAALQPNFSTSTEVGNSYHSADIDIFLYGLSSYEANAKLRHICDIVKANTGGSSATLIRSQHAVTILGEYPYRHTQIILRVYQSPAEILMGFDIDACCLGYNGKQVFALPRSRRALTKRFNLLDLTRRSLTYEMRLYKYSSRGFEVRVPGLDRNAVSMHLYQRKVGEVKGLAKLLLFDNVQSKRFLVSFKKGTASKDGKARKASDESDYSNVSLPWGPNWFISQILSSINGMNKKRAFVAKNGGGNAVDEHIFVSDLQGVLNGKNNSNCLCSMCKEGSYSSSSSSSSSSGSLRWITENPGRQILTGSFHPVTDNEWWTDAYRAWEPIPGAITALNRNITKQKSNKKVGQKKSRPFKAAIPSNPMSLPPAQAFNFGASGSNFSFGASSPFTGFGTSGPSTGFGSTADRSWSFGRTENLAAITDVPTQPISALSSGVFNQTIQPESDTSKLLLLVSQLFRDTLITQEEKAEIKNLIIRRNASVVSALEVFEIEKDFYELADSLRRICEYNRK